jgi:phosphoribosylformylglycinamidine (FGAM) synthase-like amidotransferase family enzyme
MSYGTITYGTKILFMANEFQRYGIKIDLLNVSTDKKSYTIFIEQSSKDHLVYPIAFRENRWYVN